MSWCGLLREAELHLEDELALLELQQRAADGFVGQVHVLADFFGFEAGDWRLHEVREVQVRDGVHDHEVGLFVEHAADHAQEVFDLLEFFFVFGQRVVHRYYLLAVQCI